jgi:hypothetical protein
MKRKKHPPYMFRDWPGHTPDLIAAVDAWALQLSPAWTPEKKLRRWVWRRAFELHHMAAAASTVYREHMAFSPLVRLPQPPAVTAGSIATP